MVTFTFAKLPFKYLLIYFSEELTECLMRVVRQQGPPNDETELWATLILLPHCTSIDTVRYDCVFY